MQLSTGPLTSLLTSCAAAAGSGSVLGGLAVGLFGTLRGWDPGELDLRVRRLGYYGGGLGLVALAFDKMIGSI